MFSEKKGKKYGIGERIRTIRVNMGLSQVEFSLKLNVDQKTISRYETEKSLPTVDFTNKLIEISGCNLEWFYTGEGDPFIPKQSVSESSPVWRVSGPGPPPPDSPALKEFDQGEYDLVPLVSPRLSAGGGSFAESESVESYLAFRKSWVRSVTSSPAALVLMRIDGSSMEPLLRAGDVALVDMSQTDIDQGRIYAIAVAEAVSVKRIEMITPTRARVLSDNSSEFPPYEIPIDDLRIIGRIIWFGRTIQ
jgi:phage repressor protein C with HTH and peptisase S24 domain